MKNRFFHYAGLLLFGILFLGSLLATFMPLFPSKEWYVRIFDYPRLQTFFMASLALLWYVRFYFQRHLRGYLFVSLLGLVIMIQAYKAVPYTILGPKQVLWSEKDPADTTTISLFICNVLQSNTAYDRVLGLISEYQPDLVITTESDQNWQRGLSPLHAQYPHRMAIPLANTYGMHLYSRLPLADSQVRYLLEPDIPSIRTRVQLRSGEWIQLFVMHPRPPVPGEATDSRERDAEIILVAREARKEKEGVIVAGDFNDVAWSETTELFQEVSGFLDPRLGRGFYNTFHAQVPFFRWPLDHVFHSRHFKLVRMERGEKTGSDHFPMFIRLSYEPEEKAAQKEVKPEKDTHQKATETIQEGKADARREKQ